MSSAAPNAPPGSALYNSPGGPFAPLPPHPSLPSSPLPALFPTLCCACRCHQGHSTCHRLHSTPLRALLCITARAAPLPPSHLSLPLSPIPSLRCFSPTFVTAGATRGAAHATSCTQRPARHVQQPWRPLCPAYPAFAIRWSTAVHRCWRGRRANGRKRTSAARGLHWPGTLLSCPAGTPFT